jgi:hypothetical protein
MTDETKPPIDVNLRVQQYVQVRDHLKKMDAEYEEKRKPILELQSSLAGELQEALTAANASSIATDNGTCYETVRHSTSLADPEAFMKYVINNGAFDLMDRKANATAVREFAKAQGGQLPPGVNLSSIKTIGVRRS